MKKTRSPAVTR